ncbi:alpha-D-ribose 1-methylphosphonate 5-triphosphate diphosphatase [Alkalimarinus alittae]|uniref:Alpha-D-ribose 1-methylphosphonate 5-triphosphate diphosphatase n=1 Tax=Alkalimarinus alittae TaxID=2961619 RepID=A0ABY6N2M3_9ALTE|nr:alpha-D-ribose 1-methylphosphonate 5-triphosphate diphosphatase [Alkalimarinus alittae]UZE96247.1 alpha-D-ribose 1-methylphosphonate 5-triphosphate diphosphatase [Alkalimarinus alittae]
MNKMILTNASVVTPTEMFKGTVVVGEDGMIEDISQSTSQVKGAIDCEGDFLVPGLVELHTDNLEKYFTPRPGVTWPSRSAVVTHDAQIVASGITTVFDALSLGDVVHGSSRLKNLEDMIGALKLAEDENVHRANHYLHLRCEVSYAGVLELFDALVDHPMVHLVSVMDHSPGQRQFVKEEKYREYYQGKYGFSDEQLVAFIRKQKEASALYSASSRHSIVDRCHLNDIPLASHDDATIAHADEARDNRMTVAEFPTTVEAAKASHQHGLSVLMGAPNIVRGGSHSGNVAAKELAENGVLDILSSDYYPASMMDAAFKLAKLENGYDLPKAIKTVTDTPAKSVGLSDRGAIEVGKRADLAWVKSEGDHPLIRHVWNKGLRVY